jgi:ABC-2 type transport system ATP-binding protein
MVEVRELLARLARTEKLTILISSHLLSEIELLCNRVGILSHGRMVAEGSVKELVLGKGAVEEVEIAATDLAALGQALRALQGIRVVGDGEPGRLRVALDGLGVAELNRALVQGGVSVTALVPVQRSLEDLFLSLTSKEIT